MSDYIRKAVELAGWLESDDEGEYLQIPAQPFSAYLDEITASCEQYLLDALAAQLVRQVDAISTEDNWIPVIIGVRATTIGKGINETITIINGPDRTMNTIKAIVDSEVLKQEETVCGSQNT